ncbi:type IV toxin-antitoxin system AbiEi family antitoxin [Elusimicrobiota bacterium]
MNTANIVNTDTLVKACLERLRQALGPNLAVRPDRHVVHGYDFDLHIGTKPTLRLAVEVKRCITTRNQAQHIILQTKGLTGSRADVTIFAPWIPEHVAVEFRQAGVFFIDAQGNAFIRKPPHIMIDIRGKKLDRPLKAEPGRLIEPCGLKVVHYLLTHPKAINDPFRAIAKGAGTALGTIHIIMKELRAGQWLLPAARDKRRFGDLKGLIELFVRGYALKLRPACLLGRYRHKTQKPKDILDGFAKCLAGAEGRWAVTGGMAGRELTHYLEPDNVILFVDDQARAKLEQEPMLRDDAGGNVTLLRLFDTTAIADKPKGAWPLVTPLLIYAELLETGGAREIETAKMIYKRFIEPGIAHG